MCGRPLVPREQAAAVCADPECRREMATRRERQKGEALREEARQFREQMAAAAGIKEPATYFLTLIPSFSARVVNLPERGVAHSATTSTA